MINKTNFPDWMLSLRVTEKAIKESKQKQDAKYRFDKRVNENAKFIL